MAGVCIVIKSNFRPVRAYMAGVTLLAEVALMIVVLEVTGYTRDLKFVGERIVAVAAIASLIGVLAIQRKVRIAAVIEAGVGPISRIVAVVTFFSAAPVVGVIFSMASETGCRCILKSLDLVTIQAGSLLVLPEQRIVGGVMIKLDNLPVRWRMAIGTCCAHSIVMNVVLLVARITVTGCIAKFFFCDMAIGTGNFVVLAQQVEVGKSVVEGVFFQFYDVGIASFMICMAVCAGVFAGSIKQAVETDSTFDIEGDIFMAIKAQGTLIAALKGRMAGRAFRFDFSMTLNHFSRHDQRLDAGGVAGLCIEESESHDKSSEGNP